MSRQSFVPVEQALRFRIEFEKLITAISTEFIHLSPDEIDAGIHQALQIIGEFTAVDRSYVFLIREDGTRMDNTHEWCAPGIVPQRDKLQDLDTGVFPWWMEKLRRFETIHLPRVVDLPPEAGAEKEILRAQDIQSIIVVPLVQGKSLIGFLGFDSVRSEKTWPEEIVVLLHVVGETFANALHRKQAEQILRDSERNFRSPFENVYDGVFRSTPDGRLLMANPALIRILGFESEEELLRTNIKNLYASPDDRKKWIQKLEEEGELRNAELILRRKDGDQVIVLENARAVKDAKGSVRYYEGTLTDITDRKIAEEALHESIQFIEEVIADAAEGIVVYDRELRYLVWNPFMERLSGLSPEEVLGRRGPDIFPHLREQGVVPLLEKALSGERVRSKDVFFYVPQTGRSGWVVGSYAPHCNSKGEIIGVIGVITDISERKRTEQALQESQTRLKLLNSISTGIRGGMSVIQVIDHAVRQINGCYPDLRVAYSGVSQEGKLTVMCSAEPKGTSLLQGLSADLRTVPEYLDAFRKNEPLVVEDITSDARLKPLAQALASGHTKALLSMPLIHSDRLVGLLCLDSSTPRKWSAQEIATLREVADYLTISLKDADVQQQQRHTEEALIQSETRYRVAARATNDVIWDWNILTNQVQWSEGVQSVFGYPADEANSDSSWWSKHIHPDDRDRVMASMNDIFESRGRLWSGEYRYQRKDGTYADVMERGYLFYDDNGRPSRMIGAMTDVTARKQAEILQSALYRIAEKTTSAKDLPQLYSEIHAIVGEFMSAKNLYIALYDETAQEISFPYFVDEVDPVPAPKRPGKGLTEYVIRTGQPQLISPERFEQLAEKGEVESLGTPSLDWLGVPLKTGEKIFGVLAVQSYTEKVRYGEKEKELLTFVSQHIAGALERKRALDALRNREESLRFIVEQMPAILWSTDKDFRITSSVGGGLASLSLKPNQLVGVSLLEILGTSDPEFRPVAAHMRALEGESVTYDQDWKGRSFRTHVEPLRSPDGEIVGTAGLAFDVTERKWAEDELERSLSMLRATLESTADGILVVDQEGKWVSFNQKFVEMWNIPEAIVNSRDEALMLAFVLDQVKDADAFLAKVKELYSRPEAESYDVVEFKNGRLFERCSLPQKIGGRSAGRVWSFSDVTERKRAEAVQSALYRIAEKASSASDLQEFYAAIHSIVGELMYAKNFYIALYDEVQEVLSFPYFVDEIDQVPPPKKLERGLTEYVLRTGQPLLASPERFEELVAQEEVESIGAPSVDWLGAPLKSGAKVFGVLVVQSYTENVRFGLREKEMLTFVSQHIAGALERKRAEESLRESERRFREMLENVEMVSVLLDMDGYVRFCNDHLLRLTGCRHDEVLGENWFQNFIPEDQRTAMARNFFEKIRNGFIAPHNENEIVTRTGERRLIAWDNTVLRDARGNVTGAASIGVDITDRKRMEEQLEKSLSLLRATLESTADGILVVDRHGRITTYNQRFVDMWRIPESVLASGDDSEALAFVLDQLKDPDTFLARVQDLYTQTDVEGYDILEFKDGRVFERYSKPQQIAGKGVGRVWSFSDVTERRRAEEAVRENAERYALAALGANDGLWDWNLRNGEVYYSTRWKSMLGLAEEDIGVSPEEWFKRVHPDDSNRVRSEVDAHLAGLTPHFENEHRMLHKDGSYLWVLTRGIAVPDNSGKPSRMAGSMTDVTDRRLAEERLLHEAIHDTLTGLANRALFIDLLARSIGRAKRRDDYMFAVLFLDLDRFKVINDSLGHMIGDQLLIEIGRRLESCLRPGDTVARWGGDEFTVLLDDINDVSDATRVAERIQHELRQAFPLGGQDIFTSASIGIALSGPAYERPEEILRDADTAMYRAKTRGKARHEVFDMAMHARAVALLQLETDLRRALERQEFRLYYQPTVSLKTGKITSFEALLRWEHPDRGIVLPEEFIPNAEETGLIIPIGQWVLGEACRRLRDWQSSTSQTLSISVNLSSKQFAQHDLVEVIRQTLSETGLSSQNLMLEITESMIMENQELATDILLQLKALDIQVQIDDFGTGYSSLSYLHHFPIDTLKIDRSFISRMGMDEENLEIVRAIMTLAHNLDMSVIAEGVETAEQYAQLKALQCEWAQGYYFSKPLESEAARKLIRSAPTW